MYAAIPFPSSLLPFKRYNSTIFKKAYLEKYSINQCLYCFRFHVGGVRYRAALAGILNGLDGT